MPKINPENEARRQRHKEPGEFLTGVGVSSVADVQELLKEMVGSVLQNGLEGGLDEELGVLKIRLPEQRNGQQSQRAHKKDGVQFCKKGTIPTLRSWPEVITIMYAIRYFFFSLIQYAIIQDKANSINRCNIIW